jgi:MFS family permease
MQQVGIQLVVLSLTTSALAIGMINIVSAVPMLLLSLTGGVIADQFDRRRILIVSMSVLGLFSLIYAWLIGTDTIQYWHILVFAALSGVVASFQLPASQAFVADLVDREHLPEAIALNSASFNSTRIVGPALAATAIGILGLASAFIVNAITLLAPIGTLWRLGKQMKPHSRPRVRGSQYSALKEGLRYVRSDEGMLGLMLLQAVYSFFVSPNLLILLALFVTDDLGGNDSWVGLMLSFLGVGSLAGALVLLRGNRLEAAAGKRMIISATGLVVGMGWMAISQNPVMAIPGVMIGGFSFSMGNSQISTRMQQLAPQELRGRVMSLASLAFNGVMPFSTLIISGLAQVVGMNAVLGGSSLGLGLSALYLWKRYVWKAFVPEVIPGSGAEHAL